MALLLCFLLLAWNNAFHANYLRCATLLGSWWREDGFELFTRQRFHFEKFLRHRIETITIIGQQFLGQLVGIVNKLADFFVNAFSNGFRIIALFRDLTTKEDQFLFLTIGHQAKF